MTAIKNEHNRAKTQWLFEPVSVAAGVFVSKTNYDVNSEQVMFYFRT